MTRKKKNKNATKSLAAEVTYKVPDTRKHVRANKSKKTNNPITVKKEKYIEGNLEAFPKEHGKYDWCFYEKGKQGYEGLYSVENGDKLIVEDEYDPSLVLFSGVIRYINKVQEFWSAADWLTMFQRGLPAKLIKGKKDVV